MVNDLLEGLLAELGVGNDFFYQACDRESANKRNKKVLDQIMAVDNFVAFKKLMVKRNTELNAEALKY